jgi:hypothetical protein
MYAYIFCRFKRKTKSQAIFLNLLTVCSSYKQKFVIFPFVFKETNGSYSFANGLNGLAYPYMLLMHHFCR